MRRGIHKLSILSAAMMAIVSPFVIRAAFAATLFPANGARDICPDTPLRITFPTAPSLGAAGKIQICDASSNAVVDSIDISSPTATKTIGGLGDFKYYPVTITGNDATIYPKNGVLTYGKSYYVTMEAGVFKDVPAMTGLNSWRFTTKAAALTAAAKRLVVAADGSGDFCTVQGALDFIPDGNTSPTTIFIHKGTYNEIIYFTNKHAITLLGEDRKQSIIQYANNATFNPAGGNPFAGENPNPSISDPSKGGPIYHRGVFIGHRVNDLVITNLTIHNTTPRGGSQAETIILNGSTSAHAIINHVDLYSYQDTVQINGQVYLNDCNIEGDVDFMWGTGPCFFENCQCTSNRTGAFYTQIRNPLTNHGFVYYHCTFNGTEGVRNNTLSRIAPMRFPGSEVVLNDCMLTAAVGDIAWVLQGAGDTSKIHFWEFNSHTAEGTPVDFSKRPAFWKQLKQPDDAAVIANYSDPKFVLGGDWDPRQIIAGR